MAHYPEPQLAQPMNAQSQRQLAANKNFSTPPAWRRFGNTVDTLTNSAKETREVSGFAPAMSDAHHSSYPDGRIAIVTARIVRGHYVYRRIALAGRTPDLSRWSLSLELSLPRDDTI